jgi:opacity protein-like surface antigen
MRMVVLNIKKAVSFFFLSFVITSAGYSQPVMNNDNPDQSTFSLSGSRFYPTNVRGVLALQGGLAKLNPSYSFATIGTDDQDFTYQTQSNNLTDGYVGAFVGLESPVFTPDYILQAGFQYDYFGSVTAKGLNGAGIEPQTSTFYNYQYQLQTQQLLFIGKFLFTVRHMFHPYLAAGLGAAFNHAHGYNAVTSQTGSVNLTPTFSSNMQTSFSYSVGLGFDIDIDPHARLGIGYRFSDFGKSSLGNGGVIYNNYFSPVSFSLGGSHTYVNQLALEFGYLL